MTAVREAAFFHTSREALLIKHLATTHRYQADPQTETKRKKLWWLILESSQHVFVFPRCSSPVCLPAGKATAPARTSYLLLVVGRVTGSWKMGVKWHFDFELDLTFPFHFFFHFQINPLFVVRCCNTKTQMCANYVSSLSTVNKNVKKNMVGCLVDGTITGTQSQNKHTKSTNSPCTQEVYGENTVASEHLL